MTSRIPDIFIDKQNSNKKVFISYLVCGDPSKKHTLLAMHTMAKSGVDIIELGIPFTDPIADGPIIQKSIDRALKNNTSLKQKLRLSIFLFIIFIFSFFKEIIFC